MEGGGLKDMDGTRMNTLITVANLIHCIEISFSPVDQLSSPKSDKLGEIVRFW